MHHRSLPSLSQRHAEASCKGTTGLDLSLLCQDESRDAEECKEAVETAMNMDQNDDLTIFVTPVLFLV